MKTINKKERMIAILYVFFFLSGIAGLMYEILWMRQLSIIFGHTVFAISSILSAFMGGLALGSYLVGKFADRIETEKTKEKKGVIAYLCDNSYSPYIKAYGLLQLIIGLYGLCTPVLIDTIGALYVKVMSSFSLGLFPISVMTFLLAMLIFLVPTVCMGATLPIVLKFVVKTYGEILSKTARMYSINTMGAVAGSFLAGFILFPAIGLLYTLFIAVGLNLLIGLSAMIINSLFASEKSDEEKDTEETVTTMNSVEEEITEKEKQNTKDTNDKTPETPGWVYPVVLLVLFTSGFTSMAYQVGWSRALNLSIGSSVYSYSSILTTFLFGIALGSYIISNPRWFNQNKFNIMTLANIEFLIGILGFLIIPLLGFLPYLFLKLFPYVERSYHLVIAGNFLLSFLVIILPTTLIGMTFPLCIKIYTTSLEKFGGSIGKVYASNTAGNILGAFLAGFVLIPFIGAESTLKISVALNLLAASIIFIMVYKSQKLHFAPVFRFAAIGLVFIGLISTGYWKKSAMSAGVSVYASHYKQIKSWHEFKSILDKEAESIKFYKDGISSTVTIHEKDRVIYLRVNGKTDASYSLEKDSITPDMYTQFLSGIFPLVMHRSPQRVCVIGFGSGITAGAVSLIDEVKVIDSVEIEPAVMEAAEFFKEGNLNVMQSPKFRNHIADGRNFILAAREKYDVIISEPSNPWIAGIGNLFSREFFQISHDKLNDDGVFCQWMHVYNMDPDILQTIVNTFYAVFPHGSIWCANSGDYLLIGTKSKMSFDYERLKSIFENNEKVREYLDKLGYTSPYSFLAHYNSDAEAARAFAMGSVLNTDDNPLLEFYAPLSLYKQSDARAAAESLKEYQTSLDEAFTNFDKSLLNCPDFYFNLALVSEKINQPASSGIFLEKALQVDKTYYPAYLKLAAFNSKNQNPLLAEAYLKKAIELQPQNKQAIHQLVNLYAVALPSAYSENFIRKANEQYPDDAIIMAKLVQVEDNLNNHDNVVKLTRRLVELESDSKAYRLTLGVALLKNNELKEAEDVIGVMLKENPDDINALPVMGDILKRSKRMDEAVKVYQRALDLNPDRVDVALKLAEIYKEMNKMPDAIKMYRYVLEKNIMNPVARMELYNYYSKQQKK